MALTPAIHSKLALRPPAPAAGKASEKPAVNGQEPFANLLEEKNAAGSGAPPMGNDSSGSADAVQAAMRLSGRKGEAEQAAGDKGTSEFSSPSDGQQATGLQPIHRNHASSSVLNIFPALGGAQTQSPPASLNASGTAEMPLATEFAQQAMVLTNSLDAINQSKRQTGAPAAPIAAGSFTILGQRTHFAPQTSPGFKLAQAQERTNPESTGQGNASAQTAISNVSVSVEPLAAAKEAGSHRNSPSSEKSFAAEEQAMQPAAADAGFAAQAAGQPPASPMQQIFNAIEEAMPAGAPAQSVMQANQLALDGYGPVKSLTIAFDPQGLGTVSIELSMKDSQLGVRVEASEAGTAQLLKQDDGALTKLLESGGYTVGSVSVSLSPQPPPENMQAQTGPGGQSAFSMSNSTGGGGGAGTGGQEGEANKRHDRKGSGYGRSEGANRDRSLYL